MVTSDIRTNLIEAATPLFAKKGFHGVSVRELAKAAEVNISMISYYFDGKEGLYSAVLDKQFASLREIAEICRMDLTPQEKFESYLRLHECGICFFQGTINEFAPKTASARHSFLECPKCLNNDADLFADVEETEREKYICSGKRRPF